MRTIVNLMKKYAERHNINNGIVLLFYDDESGAIFKFTIIQLSNPIIEFNSIEELKQKLQQ